jgi:hypothetical protein
MTTAAPLTSSGVAVAKKDNSKLVGGVAQAVVGGFGLWAFALGSRTSGSVQTIFGFKNANGSGPGPLSIDSRGFAIAFAVIAIICGLVRAFAPIS